MANPVGYIKTCIICVKCLTPEFWICRECEQQWGLACETLKEFIRTCGLKHGSFVDFQL